MTTNPGRPHQPGDTIFDSIGTTVLEVSDADGTLAVTTPAALTADELLRLMRERLKYYGSPLPEGYVPPPGIDIEELLKQLPPRPDAPPTA